MNIVLCTPVHGDTKAEFTRSVSRLLIYTLKKGLPGPVGLVRPELDHLMLSSSNLAGNRENMAAHALDCGADWLLWLDSDQTFPPYVLERLILTKLAVVGCNYARRSSPTAPTTVRMVDGKRKLVWTTPKAVKEGLVERVHSLGLGVCLMQASALRAIERPWFEWGPNGEDGYFFDKLAAAGIPAYVDHPLSWEVGHIGERIILNGDTNADRADWIKHKGPALGASVSKRGASLA